MITPIRPLNWSNKGFVLKCPRCGREHLFEWIPGEKLVLEGDESDWFKLNNGDRLWPDFVCRSEQCDFGAPVKLIV